jgi:hypothetical protein
VSAAANCFADQTVIVAGAVAGRCVEKIDTEIERAANGGDRLRVVCRTMFKRQLYYVRSLTDVSKRGRPRDLRLLCRFLDAGNNEGLGTFS